MTKNLTKIASQKLKKVLKEEGIPIGHWVPSKMIRGVGHSTRGVQVSKPFPNAPYYRLDLTETSLQGVIIALKKNKIQFDVYSETLVEVPIQQFQVKSPEEIIAMIEKIETREHPERGKGFCPMCGLIYQEQTCAEALRWVLNLKEES